jgi:hypothetical protein
MSNDKHTPTPWTDELFIPIPAGDDRVLLGAFNLTSKIPLRVLSEANYQHAAKCVNEYDGLIEAIATLRAEKAELTEALRAIITQWDTPNWKLTESTGTIINQARQTLTKYETK